ncbi:16597_t:CDS:1, partial [Entrophospora sp. SA101]
KLADFQDNIISRFLFEFHGINYGIPVPSHVVNNLDELLKKISGNLDDLIRKSMKYIYRNRNDANDYIDYKDFAS